MRVENQQLVQPEGGSETDAQGRNEEIARFRLVTALVAAVAFVVIAFSIAALVLLTVHTDMWSELESNHLDDNDYEQLTGDVLQTDRIVHPDEDGVIVFGSSVVIDGTVSVNRTRAEIESQLIAETITVFADIFLPDEPGSTTYRSLTETVVGLQQDCQEDELEELRNQTETFRNQIVNERTDLVECLETNNATLVDLQQNNTAQTTNHTQRLDDLDTVACNTVFQQAANQTATLNDLNVNLTVINETNIRTSGKLQDLSDILNDALLLIPSLANASCTYNEALYNATTQQLLDLRVVLNDTEALFSNITTAHVTCSAVLVNVTTALDQYETIITESNAALDGFNDTLVQYQSNYTALEIRYTTLVLNVTANNVSLVAFQTEYQTCLNATGDLEQRLAELWTRYYTILNQTDSYQTILDEIENQFNQTYTQFNATADQCDSATDLFNELLLSYNTLLAQYQTNLTSIVDIINRSDQISTNLTALIAAIEQLETDTATLVATQSTWTTDLNTINSTLLSIGTSITSIVTVLDSANATLVEIDNLFTTLETLALQLNTTLLALQSTVTNQTTTLTDHDARLTALETLSCGNTTTLYQIADTYTAGQNLTKGDVVSMNDDGEIVRANGLFVKDFYTLINGTALDASLDSFDIRGVNTVPIDSSDHFYSIMRLDPRSNVEVYEIAGRTFTPENNVVIKFSPVHEVLWTAYTQYVFDPRGQPLDRSGPEITYLEYIKRRNTLFVGGSYQGDDEDNQVEFFNSDGRSSGFITDRLTPGSGPYQRVSFFAELSPTGQWLNMKSTVHDTTTEFIASVLHGAVQFAESLILGFRTYSSSTVLENTILLPGGLTLTTPDNSRLYSSIARFDLNTFNFTYVREWVPPPAVDSELSVMDLARTSGDEMFVSLVWKDENSVGVISLDFPAVGGGNITITMDGAGGGAPVAKFIVAKLNSADGLAYWVQASERSFETLTSLLYGGTSPPSDRNYWFQPQAQMAVDHFDRVWVSLRVIDDVDAGGTLDPFVYQHLNVSFIDDQTQAVIVLRLNPRNGDGLDMYAFRLDPIGTVDSTIQALEATSFVVDDIGDLFLAIIFQSKALTAPPLGDFPGVDAFECRLTSAGCTSIVKFSANFEPEIVINSITNYRAWETSFATDSHGNLWSLLGEKRSFVLDNTIQTTDDTFEVVKFGMQEIEPMGVVDEDALAGQPVRVVYSGEVQFLNGHGFSTGQNVFNDHGALTTENVYGKTRMGVTTSNTTLVVDMHRARITQQIT